MTQTNPQTENEQQLSPLEQQIINAARNGAIAEVEDMFLEITDQLPPSRAFFRTFHRAMRRSEALTQSHSLLVLLLEEMQKAGFADVLYAARVLAKEYPESKELRRLAGRALRAVYASEPHLEHMLAACKGLSLEKVFERFDQLLRFLPGNVYTHAYWGEGIVTSLDLPGNHVTLQFESQGSKELDLPFFMKHLTYLAPDSFLCLRTKSPDTLTTMADENPVELVKLALRGNDGRLRQQDLKTMITQGVIDEGSWTSWWTGVRNQLRIDPMIELSAKGGAHAELALRDKPKTLEEEIAEVFDVPEAAIAVRITVLEHLRGAAKAGPVSEELIKRLLAHLAQLIDSGDRTPAERAELAMIYEDVDKIAPMAAGRAVAAEDYIRKLSSFEDLLAFTSVDYAILALGVLMEREGAVERAARIMPNAAPRLAQAIWEKLRKDEHNLQLAIQAMRVLLDQPLENAEGYAWAVRGIVEHKWPEIEDHIPASNLIPELIDNVAEWHYVAQKHGIEKETTAAAKLLMSRARSLLQSRNFWPVCEAAEHMSIEQVQRLRHAIQINDAFNEPFKSGADHQLMITRRDVAELRPAGATSETSNAAGPSSSDAELHWCTPKSREQKLHELRVLNTETIPANAIEIEKARQEGDLKENAGYTFAKEKQKLLMQQSLRLQHDVAAARVFDATKVKVDSIGFGVRFAVDNLKTGGRESFTILGRFETDPDKHILSYQSPFGQQFQGKHIGDHVMIKHPGGGETPYRVVTIENALASGEWDMPE